MNKRKKSKFKNFLNENKIIIIFFLLATIFFIYQHSIAFSWDFSVFALNAKYWFANGTYFEPFRPPLTPIILSIFAIFSWAAAEYVYIIFVSALFAYSSVKLAESLKLNKNIFYILSLNPYVLKFGLINGTELLSLALLELFIASLVSKKTSGYWLGLACLARYNIVSLLPLLVFHKNLKKIIKNGILFAIPFIPWFIYNYIKFGNIFMSIADAYANNIKLRDYIHQSFNLTHVQMVINFLLPFLLVGIIYVMYLVAVDFYKNKSVKKLAKIIFEKRVGEILMLIVFFAALYGYNNIPIKDVRYLFNLVMPSVYFSVLGINYIVSKSKMPYLKFVFVAAIVLLTIASLPSLLAQYETRDIYVDAIENIESSGIGNCSLMSNSWVFLSYLGKTAVSSPWDKLVDYYIGKGNHIILFYRIEEPLYTGNSTFVHSFPVVYENKNYIILGNTTKCAPIQKVDHTYVAAVNQTVYLLYNKSIDTDACNILFEGNLTRRLCNLVNLR